MYICLWTSIAYVIPANNFPTGKASIVYNTLISNFPIALLRPGRVSRIRVRVEKGFEG